MNEYKLIYKICSSIFVIFAGLSLVTAWIFAEIQTIYSQNYGTLFDPSLTWKLNLYWALVPDWWLIGIFTISSGIVFFFLLIHKPSVDRMIQK